MFSENLKKLRTNRNCSQKELAEYLSITPQSVSKWETGDALPSIEFLPKMAKYLECDINDFFAEPATISQGQNLVLNYFEAVDIFNSGEGIDQLLESVKLRPETYDAVTAFIKNFEGKKTLDRSELHRICLAECDEAEKLANLLIKNQFVTEIDIDNKLFVTPDCIDGVQFLLRTLEVIIDLENKRSSEK